MSDESDAGGPTTTTDRPHPRSWSTAQLLVVAIAASLLGGVLGAVLTPAADDQPAPVASDTTGGGSDGDTTEPVSSEPSVSTTAPRSSAQPSTSDALTSVGEISIPEGDPGELAVVLLGPLDEIAGTVPVVVRNYTDSTVYDIDATGTARTPDGSLAGSGSSQGFEPAEVGPGEWSFGYVYFSSSVPGNAEFDISATADVEPGFGGAVSASVSELTTTSDQFGQHILGIVTNETDEEMGGPISVAVACFDQAGEQVLGVHTGFAEADAIPAGGSSSFTIDLFDAPCPTFAAGSSGYTL